MSQNPVEDKIRAILLDEHVFNESRTVRRLVELVGDEKSKSYGLGYLDGQRRVRRYA